MLSPVNRMCSNVQMWQTAGYLSHLLIHSLCRNSVQIHALRLIMSLQLLVDTACRLVFVYPDELQLLRFLCFESQMGVTNC